MNEEESFKKYVVRNFNEFLEVIKEIKKIKFGIKDKLMLTLCYYQM